MSENTILYALYRLGYHSRVTGHGFRPSASTLLNELGFDADVIERQLAHQERNKVRAAYHRAEYLPERRAMMQLKDPTTLSRINSPIAAWLTHIPTEVADGVSFRAHEGDTGRRHAKGQASRKAHSRERSAS